MNHTIKNFLGVALIILVLVGVGATIINVRAYSSGMFPARTFSVFGEGEVVAIPDVAQFNFAVITEGGEDIVAIQAENTRKINSAIAFLKEYGVASEDIQTHGYAIEPRYKNRYCYEISDSCTVSEIVGYSMVQAVKVKIRDFAGIGDILVGLVERGINTATQLVFHVDDTTAFESEARTKAMEQAREKAVAVAKAGGFTLGRLVAVQENSPYLYGRGGTSALEAISAAPIIEPGSQEIRVQVTLIYEIR